MFTASTGSHGCVSSWMSSSVTRYTIPGTAPPLRQVMLASIGQKCQYSALIGPGLSTATPPHVHPDQDREYPEYPSGQGRSLDNTRGPEGELVWEYQNLGGGGTTQKPAFKRTTFCSRSIKFIAKDEAVLR